MLVKIINVNTFHGQYVDSVKVYFERSKYYSDTKEAKEGGIELMGFMADYDPHIAELRNGDIIDISLVVDKKEAV